METPAPRVARVSSGDWLFWLKWVAASTAAILLSAGMLYATIFLAKAVLPDFNEDKFMGVLIFPVCGAADRAYRGDLGGGFPPHLPACLAESPS